jgi:hypothetical protein
MATSVTQVDATIPAGTIPPAFAVIDLGLTESNVDAIRWRVPPGPRGNMGWALAMGNVQIIPDDAGTFIIADDEVDTWQIDNLPDSGAWQVIGYNVGTFDHTVYLGFFTTPIATTGTGGGDIADGFPVVETDFATMWGTDGGGTITV